MNAPPDPARRRRDLAVGLVLLAAAVAVGAFVWTRTPRVDARERPAWATLRGTIDLRAAKAGSLRVKTDGPVTLDVELDGPAGLRVAFGPPGPVESDPGGAVDPAGAVTWAHEGGRRTRPLRVASSAVNVLRVETDAAPGPQVAVEVREAAFR